MNQDFHKSWKSANEKRHDYEQTALLMFAANFKGLVNVFFSFFRADFVSKSQEWIFSVPKSITTDFVISEGMIFFIIFFSIAFISLYDW